MAAMLEFKVVKSERERDEKERSMNLTSDSTTVSEEFSGAITFPVQSTGTQWLE